MHVITQPTTQQLDKFYTAQPWVPVQQTPPWYRFQTAGLNKEAYQIAVTDADRILISGMYTIEHTHLNTKFAYFPRGPVIDHALYDASAELQDGLKLLTQQVFANHSEISFIRIEPALPNTVDNQNKLRDIGYKALPANIQVQRSWVVGLFTDKDMGMEEKLAFMRQHGMKSNVKGKIRKAHSSGVQIEDYIGDIEKTKEFLELLHRTAARQEFPLFPDDYYLQQAKILGETQNMKIYMAYYEGKLMAGAMVAIFGKRAWYLHGASNARERKNNIQIPRYLHWRIMNDMVGLGVTQYDMLGVNSEEKMIPSHPNYGFSQFKRSFGGREEVYVLPHDIVRGGVLNRVKHGVEYLRHWIRKKKYHLDY